MFLRRKLRGYSYDLNVLSGRQPRYTRWLYSLQGILNEMADTHAPQTCTEAHTFAHRITQTLMIIVDHNDEGSPSWSIEALRSSLITLSANKSLWG